MAVAIVYSPEAADHLASLSKSEQVLVVDQVELLLGEQPTLASRKRKYLRPNAIAQWALRLGDLRVFYDVTIEAATEGSASEEQTSVTIKAVGKKVHNELWVGGERVDL